jgi:outer membrane protein assembly factor BamB
MTPFDFAPLAVITLPALAPLIALIQLLFPGLLGDHWKQYRAAIGVMLSQSSLYFLQWLLLFWVEPTWWLSGTALAWASVAVATVGYIGAVLIRPEPQQTLPVKVEYLAFWGLGLASAAWLAFQVYLGRTWLDPLLVIAVGCLVTLLHLRLRKTWAAEQKPLRVPSEVVFLLVIMIGSAGLTAYLYQDTTISGGVAQVKGDVTTARVNAQRTGSANARLAGPTKPKLFWSYPAEAPKRGQMFLDCSPTVAGDALFVGGYNEVLAFRQGFMHALDARSGAAVWKYEDASLKPVFSTPSVAGGKLFFGEGYHQDKNCRLLCFDAAKGGAPLAAYKTTSHVEATPTIADERIYVGAGDDGLYCFELPAADAKELKIVWQAKGIHVDASPLVADGRVVVGGVVGDIVAELQVLAVDAKTGDVAWRLPTEIPVPAPPSYHEGGVFVTLGNGKLNQEAEKPRGAVWRIDLNSGEKTWNFDAVSSVLSSPVIYDGKVYFAARGGECFCLSADKGEKVWRAPLGEPIVSAPIVSGGRMIVLSAHGVLHCLDAKTGEEVWSFDDLKRPAADVYSSPLLVEGRIYLCVGGKVHCVGEATPP